MVRKVTLTEVNRLEEKFKLQEVPMEMGGKLPWFLIETIQPITDIDKLISIPRVSGTSFTVASPSAWYEMFAVPMGQEWNLHAIEFELNSGTWTASKIGIQILRAGSTTQVMPILIFASATYYTAIFPKDLTLRESDRLMLWVDALTGAGVCYAYCYHSMHLVG